MIKRLPSTSQFGVALPKAHAIFKGRCSEGVGRVERGYGEGVRRVCGRCVEAVGRVKKRCREGVGKLQEGCGEGVVRV